MGSTRHSSRRKDRTHASINFSSRSWGYINNRSPHAQFLSMYRSVRLHNAFTCVGKRTDFGPSDRLGITNGRETVSPSRNSYDFDLFWSQLTIDVRLNENQFLYARSRMKRLLSLSFYLSPSVGLLPTIWTRFSVRVYDRAWEASFALFLSTAERRLSRANFGTQSRSSYELK